MSKITRVTMSNYRGISLLKESVGPEGAVVKGRNGAGKTTVLNGLRAALAAKDIGPDAIRIGADKAEILVDLDHVSVRRVITARRSSLTVTGKDGVELSAPQRVLNELLGESPLDPLDLFLAKPKDRRAKILEALPITVTAEQLQAWAPDLGAIDMTGHGLEVVERARKAIYDRRTAANKAAAEAERVARQAADEAATKVRGVAVNALPVDQAAAALRQAELDLYALESRVKEAQAADARSVEAAAKVTALRAEAAGLNVTGPSAEAMAAAVTLEQQWADAVARAEEKLAKARQHHATAKATLADVKTFQATCLANAKRASELEARAGELEAMAGPAAAVAPERILLAREAVAEATEAHRASLAAKAAGDAAVAAHAAEAAHAAAASLASRLDAQVDALANTAPTVLLKAANAIEGLGLDGDHVTLDGKRLDALCGAEQMKFAVEIARRLNAKARILFVDGLERIDPESRETFIRYATAGGYQLFATLVDKGETIFAAIHADDADGVAA